MAERRYTVLLYTAVLTAVVATFGVYRVLQNAREKSQLKTRPVVVASQDLPEGGSLSTSTVEIKQWPAATIPTDAYTKADSVIGRVTRVPVFKGEAIVPARLAPAGTGPGLEVKITPGKRAMAVKINDVAGIAGLIQPNSKVDVVVTIRQTDTTRTPISKLFMQDMRVLSIGTTIDRDVNGKPITATTATLEVTPEQGEQLAVAASEGSVQLVLRGYGDTTKVKTTGAFTKDVIAQFGVARPNAPRTDTEKGPRRVVRREAAGEVEKPVVAPPPPAPVVLQAAPPPPPPTPESLSLTIYRSGKGDIQKFPKDTTKTKQPQ